MLPCGSGIARVGAPVWRKHLAKMAHEDLDAPCRSAGAPARTRSSRRHRRQEQL